MSRARDTADQINRVNSSAADATAITVDSSENVGIGVVPKTWNVYDQALQIGDGAAIWTYQNAEAHYSVNSYYNSGNKYIGTGTALQYQQAGGSHSFKTATSGTADAAISWNSKVDIDSDGLKFNGDTAAANALNDYEEGTWTPVLSSGTAVYATQRGSYTKIGRTVYIHMHVNFSSVSSSGSYDLISGLPFTAKDDSNYVALASKSNNFNWGGSQTMIAFQVRPNSTSISAASSGNNQNFADVPSNGLSAGTWLTASGSYQTDA